MRKTQKPDGTRSPAVAATPPGRTAPPGGAFRDAARVLGGRGPSPAAALRLQRAVGNRAVTRLLTAAGAGRTPLQRAITVEHVDYNPVTNEYRDGLIRQAQFYTALRAAINGDPLFANYRNRVGDALGVVAARDFTAGDMNAVTALIRPAIVGAYQQFGLVLGGNARLDALDAHIRTALAANVAPDHVVAMDENEAESFDQLVTNVGEANMSRAKGTPTPIDLGALPGNVRGQVNAVLGDIAAENARWTVAGLGPQYTFSDVGLFAHEVVARQDALHYQGNHSNLAGWLPAVPTPVNEVARIAAEIGAAASPRLRRIMRDQDALDRLGFTGPNAGRDNAWRDEYNALRAPRVAALTDDSLRLSAWAALAMGVSAYVEFNMGGGISRLVFNPVHGRVYVTAHYKWRRGFNPFFEVTGLPPL
jgi:hypothetical protein